MMRTAAPASPYRRWLFGAFAGLNGLRVVSYLPMFWAIHASGASSQHSLLTWLVWMGANLVTGLWQIERNGRRPDGISMVQLTNAAMCAAAVGLILSYRA